MKFIPGIFLIMMLLSCSAGKNGSASSVGLVQLDNYFVKNDVPLTEDTSYLAFTNSHAFDNFFGIAKTTTNKIVTPDFSGQTVVAVVLKSTSKAFKVTLLKATMAGKDLNVYYQLQNDAKDNSFQQTPMAVATVPKGTDVKWVHFITGTTEVKTIPLVY